MLPTARLTEAVRDAVALMASAMDRSMSRGVTVRCVSFQDEMRSLVLHTVDAHRDGAAPVLHIRYKLVEEPAVSLGRGAPNPCLVCTRAGALCIVALPSRAQLVLRGVLDANRRSDRYDMPPSAVSDMQESYLACAPPAAAAQLPLAGSVCVYCDDSGSFECTVCERKAPRMEAPPRPSRSYSRLQSLRRQWMFKLWRRRADGVAA